MKDSKDPTNGGRRLLGLDGLRGIAAISVVLYHFSTSFGHLPWLRGAPLFRVNLPAIGVAVFFIISGFVILLTLEKSNSPTSFISSRLARIYPPYLACMAITLTCIMLIGEPVRTFPWSALPSNIAMLGQLFGEPLVDSSYWTLQRELLFYAIAGTAFFVGGHSRMTGFVCIWVLFSTIINVAYPEKLGPATGVAEVLRQIIDTKYSSFFAIGIMLYKIFKKEARSLEWFALALALIGSAFVEGYSDATHFVGSAIKNACYGAAVYGAATGAIPGLNGRIMVAAGTISYSLYLIHQTLGLYIIYGLQSIGFGPNLSILAAIFSVILVAITINIWIEKPGQRFIRKLLDRFFAHNL